MRFAWEAACSEAAGMSRTPEKSSLSCVGSGLSFLSWELVGNWFSHSCFGMTLPGLGLAQILPKCELSGGNYSSKDSSSSL